MNTYAYDAAMRLFEEAVNGAPTNPVQKKRRKDVIGYVAKQISNYSLPLQGLTEVNACISELGSGRNEDTVSGARIMASQAYHNLLRMR